MTKAYNPCRLGNVYDAVGAGLKTSYDFGAVFYAARSSVLLLEPEIIPDPANTGLTDLYVKLQGRATETSPWQDLQIIDLSTGTQAAEQHYASMPSGVAAVGYGPLEADGRGFAGGFRVGVKIAGVPKAADEVSVAGTMG